MINSKTLKLVAFLLCVSSLTFAVYSYLTHQKYIAFSIVVFTSGAFVFNRARQKNKDSTS